MINDRSGDFCGIGLVVYELAGALSRAFSSSALAVAAMTADVFGLVERFGEPGFRGSGGGARSGSELSHLRARRRLISGISHDSMKEAQKVLLTPEENRENAYMGIGDLLASEKECWCLITRSLSRDSSLSIEGIV